MELKISSCFLLVAILASLNACGGSSSEDNAQEIRHRIFVTSTTYDGDLGGLDGADSICTSVANAAGISGSYKAIISGIIEGANFRIPITGEIYMVGLTGEIKVAGPGRSLWDEHLQNPINIDENGNT